MLEKSEAVEYEAELWVRKEETYTFAVKFPSGSHMDIQWQLEDADLDCPCSFPFWQEGVIYHGCDLDNKCPNEVDEGFNPIGELKPCGVSSCHAQGM